MRASMARDTGGEVAVTAAAGPLLRMVYQAVSGEIQPSEVHNVTVAVLDHLAQLQVPRHNRLLVHLDSGPVPKEVRLLEF